jgi:hypothetical protein
MAGRLISPNELLDAAKEQMLAGKDPKNRDDWYLIVNFMAFNMNAELAETICLVMKSLFDIPLTDKEISNIVKYQIESKSE